MIVKDFTPFIGQHCETTATGTLLNNIGIELSEPMLFGLGEGLSFLYWKMKSMEFPFLGGRIKPDLLTQNIAQNLNLQLTVKETTSEKKAWAEVKSLLDQNTPVGLKLDSYHLQYFHNKIHFAGHYLTIYGYTDSKALVVDTDQQGGQVETSLESLAKARSEKGPMASKNLYFTVEHKEDEVELAEAVVLAARSNAVDYLNPPIKNVSFKGIQKASVEILKWFEASKNAERDLATIAMLMERAGTGGALFRNLYRDFLAEAHELTGKPLFKEGHQRFVEIAQRWNDVATSFDQAAQTSSVSSLNAASDQLKRIADKEVEAMTALTEL